MTGVTTTPLTKAQVKRLREIVADSERVYNGLARKPLEALAARGLITLDYSVLISGLNGRCTDRYTARPTAKGYRINATLGTHSGRCTHENTDLTKTGMVCEDCGVEYAPFQCAVCLTTRFLLPEDRPKRGEQYVCPSHARE